MIIVLIIFSFVTLVSTCLLWNMFRHDKGEAFFNMFMILVFVGGFGSTIAAMSARDLTVDEVDVRFPIVQVDGRYLSNGTEGENNDPITIYYAKDENGATRKHWQDSGSTAIRETNGEPYAFLTCPDDSTAWSWSLFPWEDPKPNCDYEFVTFYVPEGAS